MIRQVANFGVVGTTAFVVDVALFNLLIFAGVDPPLAGQPSSAEVISTVCAPAVSWFGNRYWNFRHNRRSQVTRELLYS